MPEWPVYQENKPQYIEFADPIRTVSGASLQNCDLFDEAWEAASKNEKTQPSSSSQESKVRDRFR
jgi:hypothetical protein